MNGTNGSLSPNQDERCTLPDYSMQIGKILGIKGRRYRILDRGFGNMRVIN